MQRRYTQAVLRRSYCKNDFVDSVVRALAATIEADLSHYDGTKEGAEDTLVRAGKFLSARAQ
jgi:hypothetical protein